MNNLSEYPYQEGLGEKYASGGPDEVIRCLVSGDPEKLASIMGSEDKAFWKLRPALVVKLASGGALTEQDVGNLTDAEINALSILGSDAAIKVASMAEFYHMMSEYERAGRSQGRNMVTKIAQIAWEREQEKVAQLQEMASTKEGKVELAKIAQAELQKRRRASQAATEE